MRRCLAPGQRDGDKDLLHCDNWGQFPDGRDTHHSEENARNTATSEQRVWIGAGMDRTAIEPMFTPYDAD